MAKKFKNINRNEILKILNYRGGQIPQEIDQMIDRSIDTLEKVTRPKSVYKEYKIDDPKIKNILIGNDIKELLSNSERVLLLAVSLGQEIEMEIRRYSYSDLAFSVVLDATASAGIESLANDLNIKLADLYKPLHLTDRFSPGYGDMPIGVQENFINLLDGKKEIGLTTNESGIMIPRKSITALIGISKYEQKYRHRGCESCRLFSECEFRKRGETCGYEG